MAAGARPASAGRGGPLAPAAAPRAAPRRAARGGRAAPPALLLPLLLLPLPRRGRASAAAGVEEPPEALEARGQLPALRVGGLGLSKVFRLRGPSLGGGDWSYTHTAVGPDYQESPARRLALGDAPTLDDLSDVPFGSYLTPRERVRAFVALNAGVLSPATYNITQRLQDWGLVYDQAQQFFVPEAELNETGDNLSLLRAETEVEALTDEASQIRATAAEVDDAAFAEHFRGARGPECDGSGDGTAPCLGDHGAAMSVYEDAKNKVLVFHGSWDPSEYNYMMWAHKVWVLERFERALNIMWSIQAEQEATAEMAERSYGAYVEGQYEGAEDEKVIRCAFHDFEYKPAPDADAVALATQLLGSDIIASGFWEMVKEIVRQVIPEGGELFKTVYLTGSGRGGTFAALVSMWLKRLDATALSTYVFAPDGGWQCLARRLYARDITAHDDHSHILVYSHIMDAYAGALDKVAGQVCLYGFRNFTGAVQRFCSKIVGHTGPQLLFRGESGPPEPDPAVKKARRYFDACHYFTHSVWYAAILLLDDDVLDLSGATDGGCQTVASVPRDDAMEECPLSSPAEVDCQLAAVTGQGLPMQAMAIVGFSLLGLIFSVACCGFALLRRVRNEKWLFHALSLRLDRAAAKREEAATKARLARERANNREARRLQREKDKRMGIKREKVRKQGQEELEGVLIGTPGAGTEVEEECGDAGAVGGGGLAPIAEGPEEDEVQDAAPAGSPAGFSLAGAGEKGKKDKKEKRSGTDRQEAEGDGPEKKEKKEKKAKKDKKDKKDEVNNKEKKDKKEKKGKKKEEVLEDRGAQAPELDP